MRINLKHPIAIALLGLLFLLIGYHLGRSFTRLPSTSFRDSAQAIWTCAMHPEVRRQAKGQCPICGMHLVPLANASQTSTHEVYISPEAQSWGGVRTEVVKKRLPTKILRLNGEVALNENQLFIQTAHVSGRMERMEVSYKGASITKGDVIAQVYSPALLRTQEELLAAQALQNTQLYAAAEEKLRTHWKVSDPFIQSLIQSGKTKPYVSLHADYTGTVVDILARTGEHLKVGSHLFKVSLLDPLWVWWDVFEDDLAFVSVGDSVSFTLTHRPGHSFHGHIAFIDPIIDSQRYTARARLHLSNPQQNIPVGAKAIGYLHHRWSQDSVLWIPQSAIIWTGTQSIAYVAHKDNTHFEWRHITLGPAIEKGYVVQKGLQAGDRIAVQGLFTIDAAAQLQAVKP